MLFFLCFLFKQKTAYEMRISDWSSDVCSSDLKPAQRMEGAADLALQQRVDERQRLIGVVQHIAHPPPGGRGRDCLIGLRTRFQQGIVDAPVERPEIGRASCRERACQYV